MEMGGQRHAPDALPPGKTQYPSGWASGQSERVRNSSSPPGLNPWTVQPVASRYTDCAFPDHQEEVLLKYLRGLWLPPACYAMGYGVRG
jgi:hypothetical protein